MRKKRSIVFLLSVMIFAAILCTQPIYAWYGTDVNPYASRYNVHEDDTEKWCIEKGMDEDWADMVGDNCTSVDIIYKSNYKWHLDRHNFTGQTEDTRLIQSRNEMIIAKRKLVEAAKYEADYKKAVTKYQKLRAYTRLIAAKNAAVLYLGRSLHPIQDIYAHMDAGIDTPTRQLGISHGMLKAPSVDVKVIYPNGDYEIRPMKLETTNPSGTVLYSLYDDINYDFTDEGWIFKQNMIKEENSRWLKTKEASYELIEEFLSYAADLGIDFSVY